MLCPFCLTNQKNFHNIERDGIPRLLCPKCKEAIPSRYIADYKTCPPVVVSVVGFRGHGKTVYCASLFYAMRRSGLASIWPGFFTTALNEESLDIVIANSSMLEKGELPPSTVKNFPRPTLLQIHGIPGYPPRTLLFYDTAGEVFERASAVSRYASFVMRAHTVLFLVSIRDLENPAPEMARLLNTYIIGLEELGGNPSMQNLVVVLTQADRWLPAIDGFPKIREHLVRGSIAHLANSGNYVQTLQAISSELRYFLLTKVGAHEFVHAAEKFFKSTRFCAVSALGAAPMGHKLQTKIVPKRVLDPLIWLMEHSLTPWQRFLIKLRS